MELSDTIVAASIGATATVITASIQLVSAMRASRSDSRPKNGRTVRSVISIVALMAASALGGYMYSEVRQQRTADDLRDMRNEMNAKLLALATATERLAAERNNNSPQMSVAAEIRESGSTVAKVEPSSAPAPLSVDSELFAPACANEAACGETTAQRSSMCGVIPKDATVTSVTYFLASVGAEAQGFKPVAANQDLGGVKFVGTPTEHVHDANHKSACVELLHWSDKPHVARIEVHYDLQDSGPGLTAASAGPVVSTGASRDPSVLTY